MGGIQTFGGEDLQLSNFSIQIRVDGTSELGTPTVRLRKDMWPVWAVALINAAAAAQELTPELLATHRAADDEALAMLMHQELTLGMQAMTSAAFALDAFYASVKVRAGAHPDEQRWLSKARATPRHSQVFETLRYHLKLRPPGANGIRKIIQQIFGWRGAAVHPGSRFREPVIRDELDAAVDWHFVVFRAQNSVLAAQATIQILDILVERLERGSAELREWRPAARVAMDKVLDHYEASALASVPFESRPSD